MHIRIGTVLLVLALGLSMAAPGRDFLTTDEADQIRLLQETNARLAKYAEFAEQRLDLVASLLTETKEGRTTLIHETLEDYTRIIEAIDTVADDALLRGVDIGEGIREVIGEEEEFLTVLEEIEQSGPEDLARYRFVLENAILTTEDSLEINREDLAEREAAVADREKQQREQLEELMTPAAREHAEVEREERQEEEESQKAPSLYRPGEEPVEVPSDR